MSGHRDLYFPTMQDALSGIKEAAREFSQSFKGRSLAVVIDEYAEDKVQRGLCRAQSADAHWGRLRRWLCAHLEADIGKLTPKRATALYEHLVVTPTRRRADRRPLPPSASLSSWRRRCSAGPCTAVTFAKVPSRASSPSVDPAAARSSCASMKRSDSSAQRSGYSTRTRIPWLWPR